MQSAIMKSFFETDYGSQLAPDVQNLVGTILAEKIVRDVTKSMNPLLFKHIHD